MEHCALAMYCERTHTNLCCSVDMNGESSGALDLLNPFIHTFFLLQKHELSIANRIANMLCFLIVYEYTWVCFVRDCFCLLQIAIINIFLCSSNCESWDEYAANLSRELAHRDTAYHFIKRLISRRILTDANTIASHSLTILSNISIFMHELCISMNAKLIWSIIMEINSECIWRQITIGIQTNNIMWNSCVFLSFIRPKRLLRMHGIEWNSKMFNVSIVVCLWVWRTGV